MRSSLPWLMQFVLFAMYLVHSPEVRADEPNDSAKLVAAIDKLVEKNGIEAQGPGVAILVRQPGKVLFQKGYGLANVKTQEKITPRTMFELASVSKTFTATAVLILHDRGKLSIDDDVRKHIPEFPEYQRNNPIHIRDLLSHTSGLPEYFGFEDVPRHNKSYWVNEDYVSFMSRRRSELPLQYATGDKYEYCNTNFMLLATIVERVSGKPFGRFMHEEVFVPVGMEQSFVYENPKAVPKEHSLGCVCAVAYQWRKKKEIWEPSWGAPPDRHEELLVVGDGGVWTNLEDMTRWDIAVREKKLLKPETWKLALTPSRTRDGKPFDYGLGWTVYYDDPDKLYGYGHDGSWCGFNTSYYRYLSADRTTVLLSNRGNFNSDRLWKGLEKLIENYSPK